MSSADSWLVRYIDLVDSLERPQIVVLAALVLDFLLSPSTTNFQDGVAKFAADSKLSAGSLKVVTQGVVHQLQEAISEGYNAQKFEDKCRELGHKEDSISALSTVWVSRATNVAYSLLSRAMTNNQLKDMDWVFGVTASSDDCNHVGKTFLQLKLTLSGDEGTKTVVIELSLDQFYQFLASMQKCKSYLDYVLPLAPLA